MSIRNPLKGKPPMVFVIIAVLVVCAPMIALMYVQVADTIMGSNRHTDRTIVNTKERPDGTVCVTYFDYDAKPAVVTECPKPIATGVKSI